MDQKRFPHTEAGFTLIEVLVTALILAIMAAGTATALISAAHASGDQRLRAAADALATKDQERMRGLSDEQLIALGGAGQSYTAQTAGTTFTVTSTTEAVSSAGESSCTEGTASDFKITSTVSWGENWNSTDTSADSATVDSLIARPTTGDLLASVTDQTGQPLAGVSVATVEDSPTSESGVTDANGCLLFAGLAEGGYTIQFSKAGYVDTTGQAAPTRTVPVSTSGTPVQNAISMGLGGTITVALTGAAGATTGDADSLSWSSIGLPTPTSSTPTAAATSLTTPDLYPWNTGSSSAPSYTGNYTIWPGHCAQQEPPLGHRTTASVQPGQPYSVPISEPQLNLKSVTAGGVRVTPTAIVLTFSSSDTSGCTDRWSAPVAAAATTNTPPATGWLADPGQPYADGTNGTLTVCAQYNGMSGVATTPNSNYGRATPVPITITRSTGC